MQNYQVKRQYDKLVQEFEALKKDQDQVQIYQSMIEKLFQELSYLLNAYNKKKQENNVEFQERISQACKECCLKCSELLEETELEKQQKESSWNTVSQKVKYFLKIKENLKGLLFLQKKH